MNDNPCEWDENMGPIVTMLSKLPPFVGLPLMLIAAIGLFVYFVFFVPIRKW